MILIDELQDYKEEWQRIIRKYFWDDGGEYVVFGDVKQNIYDRALDEYKDFKAVDIPGVWNVLKESFRLTTKVANIAVDSQKAFFNDKYKSIDYNCIKEKEDQGESKKNNYKTEIRKIATQSYSPGTFDLVSFIFQEPSSSFNLRNKINFIENNRVSKWFEFSDNYLEHLKEYWYDLFEFSRRYKNSIKLNMILSYLAFKNIDLNYILFFQRLIMVYAI